MSAVRVGSAGWMQRNSVGNWSLISATMLVLTKRVRSVTVVRCSATSPAPAGTSSGSDDELSGSVTSSSASAAADACGAADAAAANGRPSSRTSGSRAIPSRLRKGSGPCWMSSTTTRRCDARVVPTYRPDVHSSGGAVRSKYLKYPRSKPKTMTSLRSRPLDWHSVVSTHLPASTASSSAQSSASGA